MLLGIYYAYYISTYRGVSQTAKENEKTILFHILFLSFPFLSFPFLYSPFLSFPFLYSPFLSFPFLYSPFLSFPFLSFPLQSFPFLYSSFLFFLVSERIEKIAHVNIASFCISASRVTTADTFATPDTLHLDTLIQ